MGFWKAVGMKVVASVPRLDAESQDGAGRSLGRRPGLSPFVPPETTGLAVHPAPCCCPVAAARPSREPSGLSADAAGGAPGPGR